MLRGDLDTGLLCKYVGENLAPGDADQVASSGEGYCYQSACAHLCCGGHTDLLFKGLRFILYPLVHMILQVSFSKDPQSDHLHHHFFKQLIDNPYKPRTNSSVKGVENRATSQHCRCKQENFWGTARTPSSGPLSVFTLRLHQVSS